LEREDAARGLVVEGVILDRGRRLLDEVSLEVPPGSLVAVTGPSGAGKTTLLSVLAGLIEPTSGSVRFAGGAVGTPTTGPRRGTALVLQGHGLVPVLTAEENILVALRALGLPAAETPARALAALDRVGVGDVADRLVAELSGGQAQRVAVARALAVGADLLLADEPTSELDEANRDVVVAALRAEAERGAAVVVATHDPEVAAVCDAELHLVDGVVSEVLAAASGMAAGPAEPHQGFRRP
jgi:putative ABC transport system ATP-binding protein